MTTYSVLSNKFNIADKLALDSYCKDVVSNNSLIFNKERYKFFCSFMDRMKDFTYYNPQVIIKDLNILILEMNNLDNKTRFIYNIYRFLIMDTRCIHYMYNKKLRLILSIL